MKNPCYDLSSRTQNFFSCHLPVVKHQRFFNASYSFHVYFKIELMFDADYRLIAKYIDSRWFVDSTQ